MLVQFTVENFLSFEKETTFSMLASADESHPEHVAVSGSGGPSRAERVLRAAAIYGANASGKSNLVQAIAFAQELVLNGTRPGQGIAVQPFRLSDARNQPSRFQFQFIAEGILYDYGFVVDSRRVHEEWLFGTPMRKGARERRFFERATTANGDTTIDFGPGLTSGVTEEYRQRLRFIAEGTRLTQLFLTEAIERNVSEVKTAASWFRQNLAVLSAEQTTVTLPFAVDVDGAAGMLLALVQGAGTGAWGVFRDDDIVDLNNESSGFAPEELVEVKAALASMPAEGAVVYVRPSGEVVYLRPAAGGAVRRNRYTLLRKTRDGIRVAFSPGEESDGTRRLLYLFPALWRLYSTGGVLIVDELDRRLHTLLSRNVVALALSGAERQGQLLFTTHDTNLLDLDLLRRDEIWFAEKDAEGASHLYSLAEFRIRPDLRVEKGYLSGRFGAIPFTGDAVRRLGLAASRASEETEAVAA